MHHYDMHHFLMPSAIQLPTRFTVLILILDLRITGAMWPIVRTINHLYFKSHLFISRLDSGPKSTCKVSDIVQLNLTGLNKILKFLSVLEEGVGVVRQCFKTCVPQVEKNKMTILKKREKIAR